MTAGGFHRRLEAYLAIRAALGFDTRAEATLLREFLAFAAERDADGGPLRAQTAVEWACHAGLRRGQSGQARRLGVARRFLAYLQALEPETEVPGYGLVASERRRRPYIFSDEEIVRLLDAASALSPCRSLRPHSYRTLIGLLASTGMRVGEARRLTVYDACLGEEPPYLTISGTKFGKSRRVVLHPSTAEMLRAYLRERERLCFDGLSDVFFTTESGKPLDRSTLSETFRRMTERLGIVPVGSERRPCLHSLRHTFAVRWLLLWRREGADVRALLPHLAVYLGHVNPSTSYWYLTATPELLDTASQAFERYLGNGGEL